MKKEQDKLSFQDVLITHTETNTLGKGMSPIILYPALGK